MAAIMHLDWTVLVVSKWRRDTYAQLTDALSKLPWDSYGYIQNYIYPLPVLVDVNVKRRIDKRLRD